MMMAPKKKLATIILGKMGESEEDKPDFVQKIGEVDEQIVEIEPVEEDNSVALEAVAEDIIESMEKKDPKMMMQAMKAMMELLQEQD